MSQMQDTLSGGLNRTEKRVSQYENLMRKFSEAHKDDCKVASIDIPKVQRSVKQFPTGSSYEGTWDVLGMSGTGVYTFPNGVIYKGEFDDGVFHGNGELRYPSGEVIKAKFRRGVMLERTLVFADGLEYSETDWKYCKMPDRRFKVECDQGLKPGARSNLTADLPTRKIPHGYYDTGDGFFDSKTGVVVKPNDLTSIIRHVSSELMVHLRNPSVQEKRWIIENCRSSTMDPLGPSPGLYETWVEPEPEPSKIAHPTASTTDTTHLLASGSSVSSKEPSLDDDEDSDVVRNSNFNGRSPRNT